MTNSIIGSRVKELREQRRQTQSALAVLLGISQSQLSKIESGRGSVSAEQLLTLLRHFNVTVEEFTGARAHAGAQIQKALAREGATQLVEDESVLPSERLKGAVAAIREALISAESARQIAAIAPVIVSNTGQINFSRLRADFAELGLENRLGWAIENTLEAIALESNDHLPNEWRRKYRRAKLILEIFFEPWRVLPRITPGDPAVPPNYDALDAEITSPEGLKEVVENLSPVAKRWKIATRIEVDDFVRALRGARGLD